MAAPTARLQFVVPSELNNYAYNPSAESVGNYTAVGAPTLSRDTTQARQVAPESTYSYKLVTTSANQGVQLTTASLPSVSIYMSAWVYVSSGTPAIRFKIGSTTITPTLYETDGAWQWYVTDTPFTSGQAGGQTAVQVLDATGSSTFYVDDVVVSTGLCRSFHGSYPNCRWSSIAHQSTSLCLARGADGRANTQSGGLIYDLDNGTYFVVSSYNGVGLPDIDLQTRETVDAGKVYQSSQLQERQMVLSILVKGVTTAGQTISTLHTRRALLVDYVQPGDAFILRYRGYPSYRGGTADVQEIECVYSTGLQGQFDLFHQRLNLTLTAFDPHFRPATATPTSLSLGSNATLTRVLVHTYTGGWGNVGSGPATDIYALAISPRGHVFAGGAGAVYGWDWTTSAWSSIGAITGGAAECYALAFDPSGQYLYAAGSGTSWGGTSANHIARYALPTSAAGVTGGTWAALGTSAGGAGALIRAIAVAANGDLYVGGDFTTLNAAAVSANYIGKWNGSAWSALGPNTISGSSTAIHALVATAKRIYLGGAFDTIGTVSAPTGLAVSNSSGSLSSGNWQYCVTSLTGDSGESAATSLAASGTSATGKSLTWNAVTGATGYNVYREASAGGGAAQVYYLTTVTTNSFTDTGQFTLNTAIEEPSTSTAGCQTKRVGYYDISGNYFGGVGVTGMADGIVRALAVADDGVTLYAVGTFTAADGATCTRAAVSNGQDWRAMGDGLDSDGYTVAVDRMTGQVVVGGSFTASGTGNLGKRLMYWHPGTATGKWVHAEFMLGGGTVRAITTDPNGDTWIGGTFNHTSLGAAQTPVTVSGVGGAFLSYPTFYVTGPGTLRYIANITTGHRIWLNLPVIDSEIVTISCRRGGVAIVSTRLNGANRIDAFIDGDLGEFGLAQGLNRVRILFHDTSTGLQAGGNAAVKVVDPALILTADS